MQRKLELEIWKSTDKLWNLSVDGVVHAQSHFELHVRNIAEKVQEYNPLIEFVEVGQTWR